MRDLFQMSDKSRRTLKESKVVLSLSGGKDSTACALLLEHNNIEFTPVFLNTEWEHPIVQEYIEGVIEPRFGKVLVLTSERYPGGMVELILKKGFFPSRKIRYCTDELKIKPFQKYLKTIDSESVVSVLGLRRQESKNRSNVPMWRYDEKNDIDVFCPLIEHSFEDVIAMHQQKDLVPNPLYLAGAQRVGCFPCIHSRKSELKHLGEFWPERVKQIAELEDELTKRARQKDPSARSSTFFNHRSDAIGHPTIETLVEWAQTDRGGKQFKLFDETSENGCSRWGMCANPLSEKEVLMVQDA